MSFWCKILGHQWNACRCQRCGAEGERRHRFVPTEGQCIQICEVCGKEEEIPHSWNHCACNRCGEVRDEDHDWMGLTECEQVCRICGKQQTHHQWKPVERGVDRCRYCGKTHKLSPDEIAERDEEWANDYE